MLTQALMLILFNLGQTFVSPSVTEPTDLVVTTNISTAGVTDAHQVHIQVIPAEPPILAWMKELPPLRKIHYSWALLPNMMDVNNEILYEYVRLTSAISIAARWAPDNYIDICVQMCKRVNLTNPRNVTSIGLNYSPFHYFYKKGDSPIGLEDQYQAELNEATTKFTLMRDQLVAANAAHDADIKISGIFLDSEMFKYKDETEPDAAEWNAAITAKYQAIQDIVRGLFPNPRIDWYGRGQIRSCPTDEGWCLNPHHPADFSSPGNSVNVSLYDPENHGLEQSIFRKTAENAKQHGITIVNPWISLGSGYRTWDVKTKKVATAWTYNWHYDLIYSWQMGAEIDNPWYGNRPERFAPWNMCEVAMFYPEPFGRTKDWGRHFVAYVRGAHNIKDLP